MCQWNACPKVGRISDFFFSCEGEDMHRFVIKTKQNVLRSKIGKNRLLQAIWEYCGFHNATSNLIVSDACVSLAEWKMVCGGIHFVQRMRELYIILQNHHQNHQFFSWWNEEMKKHVIGRQTFENKKEKSNVKDEAKEKNIQLNVIEVGKSPLIHLITTRFTETYLVSLFNALLWHERVCVESHQGIRKMIHSWLVVKNLYTYLRMWSCLNVYTFYFLDFVILDDVYTCLCPAYFIF